MKDEPDYEDEICPHCKCCSQDWVDCTNCAGDGVSGHDCGEDCCCCMDPEDNIPCDICEGKGGWYQCVGNCDKDGRHSK